ncbi:MAG: ribonuclease P protein component [Candidatus Riflemargulisbacteria bacterium]
MFKDFSFDKGLRLRKYSEFKAVYAEQKKATGRSLIVYFKPDNVTRFGVIVSKKVDKRAVKRNKIKRRIREIFRCNKPDLTGDYVIISNTFAKDPSFEELKQDWLTQLAYLKRKYG